VDGSDSVTLSPSERAARAVRRKHDRARAKRQAQMPLRNAYNYGRAMKQEDLEARGFVHLEGGTWKKIAASSGSKLWSQLHDENFRDFDATRGTGPEVWVPLWILVVWNATRPKSVYTGENPRPAPSCHNRDWRNLARALLARPVDVEAIEAAHRLGDLDAAAAVLAEIEVELKPGRRSPFLPA
jgi:hypothetical protein